MKESDVFFTEGQDVFLVDSHFHPQCDPLSESCIMEAINNGVKKLCCVSTKLNDTEFLLNCKAKYDVKIALGHHPLDYTKNLNWSIIEQNINKISAIGETGFDYQGNLQKQLELFNIQAELAIKYDLPVILHIRDEGNGVVEEFAINALKKYKDLKGVFHCFVGTQKLVDFAISQGIFVSFSGIITFKKSEQLREVLKTIPHELLMIETDAPWLAPVPLRGKCNHPMYVKYICEFMSNFLNISKEKFSEIVLKNFDNLYSKG